MYLIHSNASSQMMSTESITSLNIEKFIHRKLEFQQPAANDDAFKVMHLHDGNKSTATEKPSDQERLTLVDQTIDQLERVSENNTFSNNQLDAALNSIVTAGHTATLMLFRLNGLQTIKKFSGQQVITKLNRMVAARLRDNLRTEAVFEQIAENEFAIVFEDLTETKKASAITQRLLAHCSGFYVLDDRQFYLHTAISHVQYTTDTKVSAELIRDARIALRNY